MRKLPLLCPTCGRLVPREYSDLALFPWAPPLDSGWEPSRVPQLRVQRCACFHGFQYDAQADLAAALTLPVFVALFNDSPKAAEFKVRYDPAVQWEWCSEARHYWSLRSPELTFIFAFAPGPEPVYRPWGMFPPWTEDSDAALFWALCAAWYDPTGNEPRR